MCKKTLASLDRECPRCRFDLSLLAEYVVHMDGGLARADRLTCNGELGEAVWAYLAVLEVDPDQPVARRQVGQVAAAVRQFDRSAPGRRWLKRLRRQARFRRWLASWESTALAGQLLKRILWIMAILAALAVGLLGGYLLGRQSNAKQPPVEEAPAQQPPAETSLQRLPDLRDTVGATAGGHQVAQHWAKVSI